MLFLIAIICFGVFIYLGATIASMVWLAIACAVGAYGFWVKGHKRNALYALGACLVVFAAAGFNFDGLTADPAVLAAVALLISAIGGVHWMFFRKKSGGDPL